MPQVVSLTYGEREARRDNESSWAWLIEEMQISAKVVHDLAVLISDKESVDNAVSEIISFSTMKGVKIESVQSATYFTRYGKVTPLPADKLAAINVLLKDRVDEHVESSSQIDAYVAAANRHLAVNLPDISRNTKNMDDTLLDLELTLDIVVVNMRDTRATGESVPLYEYDPNPPAPSKRVIQSEDDRLNNHKDVKQLFDDLPDAILKVIITTLDGEIKETVDMSADDYTTRQQDREDAYDLYMRSAYRQLNEAKVASDAIDMTVLEEVTLPTSGWSSYAEDREIDALLTGAQTRLAEFDARRKTIKDTLEAIQLVMRMLMVAVSTLYDDFRAESSMVKEAIAVLELAYGSLSRTASLHASPRPRVATPSASPSLSPFSTMFASPALPPRRLSASSRPSSPIPPLSLPPSTITPPPPPAPRTRFGPLDGPPAVPTAIPVKSSDASASSSSSSSSTITDGNSSGESDDESNF
jgi:hypothetical protein